MREEKILELHQQNLDELLKNELNHEEPPWRTPVTKGWRDRMKEERIRWALRWFRWGFRRHGRGNLNSGEEKMRTLGTRIYSSRTNSEGREYSLGWNKNKIYCMLILHQIKLMTSNGFWHTTYSSWKGLREIWRNTWERSSWTTGRIEKQWMDRIIIKEKNLEWTTVRIQKWLMKEIESPGRIRRTNKQEGI